MIKIIISKDPSTQFLFEIIDRLKINGIDLELTEVHPNEESYSKSFEKVSKFDKDSTIVFLGHGTNDRLYGGEDLPSFEKKDFINKKQMSLFESQNIFALSCNSAGLIKSSHRLSKLKKSIGFGGLPTSKEEIEDDKKLKELEVSESTIEEFKSAIVETVSTALSLYHADFNQLYDYLSLLIDKRINKAVIIDNDRNLADLLFNMRNEMIIY